MARSYGRDPSITQSNNKHSISSKRGMSHRAKRHSNKADRQFQKQALVAEIVDAAFDVMHHDRNESEPETVWERDQLSKRVADILDRQCENK